jgi:hypothetical protein
VLGLGTGQAADLAVPLDRDELIAYGPRLSDNGATRLGTAALVRRPDPDTACAIPTPDRYADPGCTTGSRQAVVMTEDIQADATAETLRIAQHPRVSPEPTDASA